MKLLTTAILILLTPLAAAGSSERAIENDSYTLYRSSPVTNGDKWRVHVATFDVMDGLTHNRELCILARDLFLRQEGVTVSYWCERGFYKKK